MLHYSVYYLDDIANGCGFSSWYNILSCESTYAITLAVLQVCR